MKKAIGILAVLMVLMVCAGALPGSAGASMLEDDPFGDMMQDSGVGDVPADTLGDESAQSVAPAQGGGLDSTVKSGDRWLYPVPLSALFSEYNRLVNRDNKLTSDYEPEDLVKLTVKGTSSQPKYLRRVASDALSVLFDAATEAGYQLYADSAYRSYGSQKTMYYNRLQSHNGKDDGYVAPEGSSEHQTGLAVDIKNSMGKSLLTTEFAATPEGLWLKENCASFGFILRYPKEGEEITQVKFEPWHFRYVGKEVAAYVMRAGFTYEEFFDEWQLAVAQFEGLGGNVDEEINREEERRLAGPESEVLDIYGEDGDAEISLSF